MKKCSHERGILISPYASFIEDEALSNFSQDICYLKAN